MSCRKTALYCATATLAFSAIQLQAARAANAPAPAGQNTTVQEVVVTAQKREQSINSVGMSIQAASGDQLTKLGVTDTAQLQKIVPGFSYVPSSYGTPVYSIRGIGFQDTSLAASPTVSVYVDETPLPFSIMTQGASLDLQRVEVLKGPQGTLFGENATGGAINYVANKPTDQFTAGMDLSYGRFNTTDLQGFVSGPIADNLDVRLALRSLQGGDWQKSYTRDATLGTQNFLNGRMEVLWKPTSKLRMLLTVSGYKDRSETQAPQLFGIADLNANTQLAPGLVNYPLAPHNDRAADWDTCINISPFNNKCTGYRKDNTFYSTALRIDYELPGDMTLTSLTAYEDFIRDQPLEGDGTTYQDYASLQRGFLRTTYQELRLAGRFSGRGNWIVGGNFQHDDTFDNFLQSYADSSSSTIFGMPLGPTNPINRQKTNTYAVFGNVEYPVTDTVTLQAGVRYTQQNRSFFGCGLDGGDGTWAAGSQEIQNLLITGNPFSGPGVNPGPGGCGTTGPAPTFAPGIVYNTLNQNNVAWRLGANWKVIPGTLLYVNVSQGYKSGGFPTVATARYLQLDPASQEKLIAYEGGFKASLFDHTLQLNGAGFYYHYKNKQILGDVDDLIFGALPALVNVPQSHVVGFEFSGAWTPAQGVTITPSVSYSHSRIDGNFSNFNYLAQVQNFTGEAFPLAPEWQADIDAQYEWSVHNGLMAFVGANASYQGDTNSGFGDFAVLDIPGYTLLDLRAGLEKDAWRLQVWGRNVTNKYYWTTAYHVNDAFVRYAGMPVTYGVTLSYRFK